MDRFETLKTGIPVVDVSQGIDIDGSEALNLQVQTETLTVLNKARKLLDTPEKWTQYVDASSREGKDVCVYAEAAACFSIAGAVLRASRNSAYTYRALAAIAAVLPTVYRDRGYYSGLMAFNDNPRTTHEMVIDVLGNAVAYVDSTRDRAIVI